eukprot:CAMPEP_0119288988 /NCGR_PEP_ID=MMETSP1329-20130426/38202_1 /TAXON_ID=114041 /ORGANISM="Genus nov. species nov., Strain RCC1024" /LENGTH=314 /DNA_ID=CAMNT_0007289771 /DNA_START=148 /DNA_END=1088 /DNA_ORIENTATION=+
MSSVQSLKQQVMGGDWSPATLRALADATEKDEAAAAAAALLKTGTTVRVPRGDACVRAMVSDLDGPAGTVDVVYEADAGEATVPAASAAPLLDFEVTPPAPEKDSVDAAGRCKERGTALFKAKDWVAAASHYRAALGVLRRLYPLSCGALALCNSRGQLRVGTVTDLADRTVDVMYDDGGEDDDELDRRKVLGVVAGTPEGRQVQLTTYLNLARCGTRAGRAKDAVACCTLAGGIAAFDAELAPHLLTCKVLRARAHMAQKHLKQALRDAKAASELAPEDRNVVALNRDVEKMKKLALRENKKLAKEMTAWVET